MDALLENGLRCCYHSNIYQGGSSVLLVCKHDFTIDNRGGRRDWKRSYVYTADAPDRHVTLSKVHKLHNFATPQRLHLERVFVHCSRVARGPEVKRRKNQAPFLSRWAAIWSSGIFLGPASDVSLC